MKLTPLINAEIESLANDIIESYTKLKASDRAKYIYKTIFPVFRSKEIFHTTDAPREIVVKKVIRLMSKEDYKNLEDFLHYEWVATKNKKKKNDIMFMQEMTENYRKNA